MPVSARGQAAPGRGAGPRGLPAPASLRLGRGRAGRAAVGAAFADPVDGLSRALALSLVAVGVGAVALILVERRRSRAPA